MTLKIIKNVINEDLWTDQLSIDKKTKNSLLKMHRSSEKAGFNVDENGRFVTANADSRGVLWNL